MRGRRRTPKPRKVVVYFRETPYCLDLVACRKALVRCQVEGKFDSMEALAVGVGCSRSTASRFFSGRLGGLGNTLRILEQLGLRFDDVAVAIETLADCSD